MEDYITRDFHKDPVKAMQYTRGNERKLLELPYVKKVEGTPGLVVEDPVIGELLLHRGSWLIVDVLGPTVQRHENFETLYQPKPIRINNRKTRPERKVDA